MSDPMEIDLDARKRQRERDDDSLDQGEGKRPRRVEEDENRKEPAVYSVVQDVGALIAGLLKEKARARLNLASKFTMHWVKYAKKCEVPLKRFYRSFINFYRNNTNFVYLPEDVDTDMYIYLVLQLTEKGILPVESVAHDCKSRYNLETFLQYNEQRRYSGHLTRRAATDMYNNLPASPATTIRYISRPLLEMARQCVLKGIEMNDLPDDLVKSLNYKGCIFFAQLTRFRTLLSALYGNPFVQLNQLQPDGPRDWIAVLNQSFGSLGELNDSHLTTTSPAGAREIVRKVLAVLFHYCVDLDNVAMWNDIAHSAADRFNRGHPLYTIDDGEYQDALVLARTRNSALAFLDSIFPSKQAMQGRVLQLRANSEMIWRETNSVFSSILTSGNFGIVDAYRYIERFAALNDDPYPSVLEDLNNSWAWQRQPSDHSGYRVLGMMRRRHGSFIHYLLRHRGDMREERRITSDECVFFLCLVPTNIHLDI